MPISANTRCLIASAKVTIESLLAELEDARAKATSLGQLSAAVRASAEKARVSGLLIERAQVEVVQPDYFGPALSVEEILQKVAKEAGLDAAVALARAFKLDPKDYDFEPVAEPAPVASTPSRLGYSQRLIEERRPISNGRKREV